MLLDGVFPWWRHHIETFSASLALCAGNSPVTGEFPSQRPVTRSFDVFFYLRLNKLLSKQSMYRWFEMPSRSLWRHCNPYQVNPPSLIVFSVGSHPAWGIAVQNTINKRLLCFNSEIRYSFDENIIRWNYECPCVWRYCNAYGRANVI